jgi:hypothetical protein
MSNQADLAAGLRKVLNRHGHAFQQAVIQLCMAHASGWEFLQAEFPYELHGDEGHVDFVLRHQDTGAMLAAECKRVDPAKGRWCFARTSYIRLRAARQRPVISMIQEVAGSPPVEISATSMEWYAYHLGFELRTQEHGDGGGKDKELDGAIAQAYRGASGLLQHLAYSGLYRGAGHPFAVVPVIFTTAELFVTDAELADAEITTGNLAEIPVAPVPWLWFQMNLSKSLRPSDLHHGGSADWTLDQMVLFRRTRGVCIVNARSIPAFLSELNGLEHLRVLQ